jgi:hypothetical protein
MKSLDSLSEDQELLLRLATAFHVIDPALAGAWRPERTKNGIRKSLRRLTKAGLLHRYACGGRDNYFVLSRRAVRLLDLPPRRVGPLGWPALIQAVGVLGACARAGLDKLTAADFASHFPDLSPRRGAQSGYYALTPEDGLAWVVVDHGATGFTLAKKVQKITAQRYRLPAFRELIQGGGFTVVIATGTPEKAADIEAALEQEPPRFVRAEVVVVTELLALTLQKGRKS